MTIILYRSVLYGVELEQKRSNARAIFTGRGIATLLRRTGEWRVALVEKALGRGAGEDLEGER